MTTGAPALTPTILYGARRNRCRAWSQASGETLHFQIGVVPISLRCTYRPAWDAFRALYPGCERPEPNPGAIEINVVRTRAGRLRRRYYDISADGTKIFSVRRARA
ncbi:MAG: hypothetical protein IID39_00975, partial [Planctomycetes bacterium]|nr:hypothetical protein [Planctomycetota bacterium]